MNVVNSYQPKRLMNKTKSEKLRPLFLEMQNTFKLITAFLRLVLIFILVHFFRN